MSNIYIVKMDKNALLPEVTAAANTTTAKAAAAAESATAAEAARAAAEALALQDYTGEMKVADIITKGPWVDVRAFGAIGDGLTDDTAAIQAAHDWIAATGRTLGFASVVFPAGTYLFSSLQWSPLVHMQFVGTVILKTAIVSGNAINISTRYGNWDTIDKQLAFATNTLTSGRCTLLNTNDSNAANGLFFGDTGVETYSAQCVSLDGFAISGFSVAERFGSHAYLICHHNCDIRDNGSAIYVDVGSYIDRLERISYDNCTICKNVNVIDGDTNYYGDFNFVNCSFDYNTRIITNIENTAIVNFDCCHFEWNSNQTLFNIAKGVVRCRSSYFYAPAASLATPFIAAISGGGIFEHAGCDFNTPTGAMLFLIEDSISRIVGDRTINQFGGQHSQYQFGSDQTALNVNNAGSGILQLLTTLQDFDNSAGANGYLKLPGGYKAQWGTIPSTAIGANTSLTITATFPSAFTGACVFAIASVCPSGSADFYGQTQRIEGATPLASTQFAIRNGGAAQTFNGTWFALGYDN